MIKAPAWRPRLFRLKERNMPLFIVVVFLVVYVWLVIAGFMAFMPGATGTNRAAFILWLLFNVPIALGLATHWWEKRKRPPQ
jgi:hypothetical protein